MNNPAYSIIVPVFNSEPSLEELFEGIRSVFDEIQETFEVIFVDDHSKDQSWEVLKKIKASHPEHVTAITLRKNFGQHNATFCGFSFAKGSFVITIDDDLQTPPAEIRKLITEQQHTDADIVYGFYPQKKANLFRRLGSKSVKQSSGFLRDTLREGSSFRLIRRELVDRLLDSAQHFLFIDEMLQWYTDNIRLVEVQHLPRKYAQSNYSSISLFKLLGNIIFFYTTIPLKVLVYGGLTVSVITLLIGFYHIFRKLFLDVPIPGYTSLIVAVLFSTSIILFSLGVIGEYLSRIYSVQSKKPPYSIRKVL